MSTLATPALSVAVQVMFWLEPITQNSPPFGLVTLTTGAALSIGTVAGGPAARDNVAFEQSRSFSAVIVTVPGPVGMPLATASVNSVPLVPVGPQFETTTSSTVYEPPPLSVT